MPIHIGNLLKPPERDCFNLKDKLTTHYQALIEKDYLSEILEEPRQMELKLAE